MLRPFDRKESHKYFYECLKDFKNFMKGAVKMKREWLNQGTDSNNSGKPK